MVQALDVFLNGIGGVFAGLGVLYITLKLLALLPERGQENREDKEQ